MTWTAPTDPWGRLQRRRLVLSIAMPVVGLTSIIGMNLALSLFMPEVGDAFRAFLEPPLLFLTLLGVAAFILPSARTAVLEWQVLRRIPQHDGAVCVRCRRPLPVPPGADRAAIVACAGCGTRQSAHQARDAWATYPTTRGPRGRASLAEADGAGDADGPRSIRMRLRSARNRPMVTAVAWPVLAILGLTVIFALLMGQSILGTLFDQLPMVMLISGMMLIGAGIGVRRGHTRHCRQCNYQMPPADAPEHCPECGAAWTKHGASLRGAPVRRPGIIIAGAVVLLLAGVQMFDRSTTTMAIQPTGVIVSRIITGTGWNHRNWPELQNRTLNAAQDTRLAEGLLDLLEDEQYVANDGHAWLQQRMGSGTATPSQVARYVRDSMTVSVVRAPDAVVGAPLALAVDLRRPPRLQLSTAGMWAVFVGDVALFGPDGARVPSAATAPAAVRTAFQRASSVDATPSSGRTDPAPPVRLELTGPTPAVPGGHRVRIEFWRAIVPWGSNPVPVTRDAEGTVIIPPGVRWAERMVVEQDLEIAEADGS